MVYNNDIKKWEHAGGSQGISEVHVYHNQSNNNYRIVGRKLNDREVRIGLATIHSVSTHVFVLDIALPFPSR